MPCAVASTKSAHLVSAPRTRARSGHTGQSACRPGPRSGVARRQTARLRRTRRTLRLARGTSGLGSTRILRLPARVSGIKALSHGRNLVRRSLWHSASRSRSFPARARRSSFRVRVRRVLFALWSLLGLDAIKDVYCLTPVFLMQERPLQGTLRYRFQAYT